MFHCSKFQLLHCTQKDRTSFTHNRTAATENINPFDLLLIYILGADSGTIFSHLYAGLAMAINQWGLFDQY